MSETSLTPDSLDAIEWAIACTSLYHERTNGGDAEWAVWQRVPCGCGKRPDFGYACAACFDLFMTAYAYPACRDCGWKDASLLLRDTVVRFERIRGDAA